jgi:hypothetical protein
MPAIKYDFQYWFDQLVELKHKDADEAFIKKERRKWSDGKFTDLVQAVEKARKENK